MVYGIVDIGVVARIGGFSWLGPSADGYWDDPRQHEPALRMMAELGFGWWRADWFMNQMYGSRPGGSTDLDHFDWVFQLADDVGLKQMHSIGLWIVPWLSSSDVHCLQEERPRGGCHAGSIRDLRDFEEYGRFVAARWPQIDAFKVGLEPNLQQYRIDLNPQREVSTQKALALGIWYENPSALIVAANVCCFYLDDEWYGEDDGGLVGAVGKGIHGMRYLEAMYEAGQARSAGMTLSVSIQRDRFLRWLRSLICSEH